MKSKENIELNNSLKRIMKSSLILFFGIALSKILTYIYRIMIARTYGPNVYGLFTLSVIVAGLIIAIAGLGLYEGLTRFIPIYRGKNEHGKIKYLVKFVLFLLIPLGIACGIILFFLSEHIALNVFKNPNLTIFLKIFSFLIPLTAAGYPFLYALQSYEKIGIYSFIVNIAQNLIRVVLLGIFLFFSVNVEGIAISYVLGTLGLFLLSWAACRFYLVDLYNAKNNIIESDKRTIRKEVVSYSLPLMFFGVISMIFNWMDSFSIGYLKSATEVGFYNAAVPLAALVYFVPELFIQLFFPIINKEYASNNLKLIKSLSKHTTKWIFIMGLPITLLLILFPDVAIKLFFGEEYFFAANALRMLSVATLISALGIVSNRLLSMIGKSKLILLNIILASIVNLSLNFIFIPMKKILFIENSLGINGAALATLIAVLFFNLLFILETYYYIKIVSFKKSMGKIFLISLVPLIIAFYLMNYVEITLFSALLISTLFFLIYLLLVFLVKGFDEQDIDIAKTVYLKIRSILKKE